MVRYFTVENIKEYLKKLAHPDYKQDEDLTEIIDSLFKDGLILKVQNDNQEDCYCLAKNNNPFNKEIKLADGSLFGIRLEYFIPKAAILSVTDDENGLTVTKRSCSDDEYESSANHGAKRAATDDEYESSASCGIKADRKKKPKKGDSVSKSIGLQSRKSLKKKIWDVRDCKIVI